MITTKKIIENNIEYLVQTTTDYYNKQEIRYILNGKLHREIGPALINSIKKEYYKFGKYHRLDGPAVEWNRGDWIYYVSGKKHRDDGPAVFFNGLNYWWFHNTKINVNNLKDFLKETKYACLK